MQATLRVLASGSSGNALLVRIGPARLLVDAGLPLPLLAARLAAAGTAPGELDAILVSHEHADHARGLPELAARHPGVPILASPGTARALAREQRVAAEPRLAQGTALLVAGSVVAPFAVPHDAAQPVGLRIERGDFALAVATDLGEATPTVVRALSGCRAVVLEANHDLDLLAGGPYPPFLKRRVTSRRGHLSNDQAAALLARVAGPWLQHVTLAHASAANNSPERALAAATHALAAHRHVAITVAERDRLGAEVAFDVDPSGRPPVRFAPADSAAIPAGRQLPLFGDAP
jgi:phosphoribosyl 1,2-cyclic phosphodiesterase